LNYLQELKVLVKLLNDCFKNLAKKKVFLFIKELCVSKSGVNEMNVSRFVIGIGSPRCGTSFLHDLLGTHPDVQTPQTHKELNFWNQNYEKGLGWYVNNFNLNSKYKYIHEFTPGYLCNQEVPLRIVRELGKSPLFIVILRNPVDRLYSHFKKYTRDKQTDMSFREFTKIPQRLNVSMYGCNIKHWLNIFPRENFLFLEYEYFFQNPEKGVRELAEFLGIDTDGFDTSLFNKKINTSETVSARGLYKKGHYIVNWLRSKNLHYLANQIVRTGRLLMKQKPDISHQIPSQERQRLQNYFKNDVRELEMITGKNFEGWFDG